MKFLLSTLSALSTVFLIAGAAQARPECTSRFCIGKQGGEQCTIDGQVHTCGNCMSGTNAQHLLIVGNLSQGRANHLCSCGYDKTAGCERAATTQTVAELAGEKITVTKPSPSPATQTKAPVKATPKK